MLITSSAAGRRAVLDQLASGARLVDPAQAPAQLLLADRAVPWPEGVNPWTIAAELMMEGLIAPIQRGDPVVYQIGRAGRAALTAQEAPGRAEPRVAGKDTAPAPRAAGAPAGAAQGHVEQVSF